MDYLQEKESLLSLILENTQAQTKLVKGEDMDVLEELIAKRQVLMDEVDELDKQAADITNVVISEQTKVIKSLLSQIIAIDNTNKSLMKKELDNVQGELLKIRTGKQQEQNYGTEYGKYKEEGIFFDTKE